VGILRSGLGVENPDQVEAHSTSASYM
jgi:hypothetical protein